MASGVVVGGNTILLLRHQFVQSFQLVLSRDNLRFSDCIGNAIV